MVHTTNVIVVFPNLDNAKTIKNMLVRSGYTNVVVCTTGAQALHFADGLTSGLLISAYKLPDMLYEQIKEDLPPEFDMLLIASRKSLADFSNGDVVALPMPFAMQDLINTVEMMMQNIIRRNKRRHMQKTVRNEQEQKLIQDAKELLMVRNNLTETEAYRYIQKSSMDSGTNMVETAQMVLSMMQS